MFQNILVAIEGKSTDEAALAYTTTLALQDSAKVTLVEIVAIAADDSGMRHLQMEAGASGWRRKNRAEERLAALERQLHARGLSVQKTIVVGDRTEADEIVDFIDKNRRPHRAIHHYRYGDIGQIWEEEHAKLTCHDDCQAWQHDTTASQATRQKTAGNGDDQAGERRQGKQLRRVAYVKTQDYLGIKCEESLSDVVTHKPEKMDSRTGATDLPSPLNTLLSVSSRPSCFSGSTSRGVRRA